MVRQSIIGLAAYLLLFLLAGSGAVYILPLIVSLLFFITSPDFGPDAALEINENAGERQDNDTRLPSMALAPMTVFLGSFLGSMLLSPRALVNYGSRGEAWPSGLILTLLANNQMTKWSTISFITVSTIFAAAFALCLFLYGRRIKRAAPGVLLVLILAVFITASITASTGFRNIIAVEPKYNNYSYDGLIYLKTFYLMANDNFYRAYVEAASGDSRLIPVRAVRQGKFYGYVSSPFYFRLPILFYIWRFLAGKNGIGVFYLALAFSSGIIILSFSTARKLFGNHGALAAIAIVPYLFIGQNGGNMLLPDWWAANAMLAGIFFWLKKQFWPSALAFLAAALFREVLLFFLLLFLVFSFIWEKTSAVKFIAAAGAFVPLYAWHYAFAGPFIGMKESTKALFFDRLTLSKFSLVANYQFFIYGFNLIPVYVIMIMGALGWLLVKRWDMLFLCLLAFPYFAVASSPYWGQHLMLFLAFSAAIFCLRFPSIKKLDI